MTSEGSAVSNETRTHHLLVGYTDGQWPPTTLTVFCDCGCGYISESFAAASRLAELQEQREAAIKVADRNAEVAADSMTKVQALQEELDAARAELADERAARMEESQEVGRLESLNDAVMDGNKKLKAANATLTERAALADEIAIHLREVFPLSQAGWLARYDALAK